MTAPTVWRAHMDSRSFRFEAYGATEAEARAALTAGLRTHTRQYHLRSDWYHPHDLAVVEYRLGEAYRDDESISGPMRPNIWTGGA